MRYWLWLDRKGKRFLYHYPSQRHPGGKIPRTADRSNHEGSQMSAWKEQNRTRVARILECLASSWKPPSLSPNLWASGYFASLSWLFCSQSFMLVLLDGLDGLPCPWRESFPRCASWWFWVDQRLYPRWICFLETERSSLTSQCANFLKLPCH